MIHESFSFWETHKSIENNEVCKEFPIPEIQELVTNDEICEGLRLRDFELIANTEGLSMHDWQEASILERLDTLQNLENELAAIQNRKPQKVVAEPMKAWGYYTKEDDCIHLNPILLSNPELRDKAIETIAHEGRHAYQWHAITHPGFHNNAKEVEYWTANLDSQHYLPCDLYGFDLYSRQPVELDAFKYGTLVREGVTNICV